MIQLLIALMALPAAGVTLALLLGLGTMRQGAPLLVAVAATLLLVLPAMGLASLTQKRQWGGGLLVWSGLLFLGVPLYFPGERGEALHIGAAMVGGMFGVTATPTLIDTVEDFAPAPTSRALPMTATEAQPVVLPPSAATTPDQVVIPYEGSGSSLLLEVGAVGVAGDDGEEVMMLFDTGATLTTMTQRGLASLGVRIPADAPDVTMHTAAGKRQAKLVLIDGIWIGGFHVQGVTISVCDACSDGRAEGLLGLNVSGQFLVTLDTVRQEVILQPREQHANRTLDIQPWLSVDGQVTRWPDGRVEVEVTAHNRSHRPVTESVVAIECGGELMVALPRVAPGQQAQEIVTLPRESRCDTYGIRLKSARW